MISIVRNGGLLGAVLAASAFAGPVAVRDVEVAALIELASYSLETTHVKDVLLDIGAALEVDGVSAAAELVIGCENCQSWGRAVVSTAGAQKNESLLDDIVSFFENPIETIVAAFDLDIRVDFEDVGGHFEFDIQAAAGNSYSIPIFESEVGVGIAVSEDVTVGLLLAIDLVFSLDAAIDVEAGFEFSLPQGTFITVDSLTGDIVDKSFVGGVLSQLPITVKSGAATIEAALRVRVQAGIAIEVFGTGFEFELGLYADLMDYTAVIATSNDCELYITESVELAVGVFALVVVEIDYVAFTAVPAVVIVFLELDLQSQCLSQPSSPPTLPSSTATSVSGLPSGTATSVSGDPSGTATSVSGDPSGTATSVSGDPSGTATSVSGDPSGTATSVSGFTSATSSIPFPINSTITAAALTTSTFYSTDTITITSCASTVLHCPASLTSQIVITSTKTQYTTICPVTETQNLTIPASSSYSSISPSSIVSGQSLTPISTPVASTIYTPTVNTPTYTLPTATSFTVANPGFTASSTTIASPSVVQSTITMAPVLPTTFVPIGSSPSGVPVPSAGNSTIGSTSAPTATTVPFTGGAVRSSGTVMSALVVALAGSLALM